MKLVDRIAELRPRVYNIAMKLTRNYSDAEDITQATMERAFQRKGQYKEGNLIGWLSVLTYGAFIDSKRKQRDTYMDPAILESLLPQQRANQEDAAFACEVLNFMKSRFTPLQFDAMIPGYGRKFEPDPQNVTTRRNRGREKLALWLEAV